MALQYVADVNLQTVTLGSNYTLGDTSMVLTTGQGARLPSSGDFWIMTPDTAPPNRIIWKVTARSSDTLTVVYDNSYGADANLTTGTRLMWSLTAEALTQLKTDIAGTYGTFANLPAATAGVVRYDFAEPPYSHAISDGSAWHYFAAGCGEVFPPDLSAYTAVNESSVVTTDTTFGGVIYKVAANATQQFRYRYAASPTPPYSKTFIISRASPGLVTLFGFGFGDTAGKTHFLGNSLGSVNWDDFRYDASNVFAGSGGALAGLDFVFTGAPYMAVRITDDGANFSWSLSPNCGSSWFPVRTVSRTVYLGTPNKFLWGVINDTALAAQAHLISIY
jgi:hypothetical protein